MAEAGSSQTALQREARHRLSCSGGGNGRYAASGLNPPLGRTWRTQHLHPPPSSPKESKADAPASCTVSWPEARAGPLEPGRYRAGNYAGGAANADAVVHQSPARHRRALRCRRPRRGAQAARGCSPARSPLALLDNLHRTACQPQECGINASMDQRSLRATEWVGAGAAETEGCLKYTCTGLPLRAANRLAGG